MSGKRLIGYSFCFSAILLLLTTCSLSQKIKEMKLVENVDLDRYVDI
jgi:hypothetical protein